jgi:hypothetical protein
MVIATGDGQVFKDRFDQLSRQFQPAEGDSDGPITGRVSSNFPNPFEDIHKYVPGSDKPKPPKPGPLHFWEDPKVPLPPVLPMQPGGSPLNQNIDRNHHVPLAASGILDERGNMTGLAIDHRAPDPPDPAYFQHVALHEATEIPHMHNLMSAGKSPQEAYYEAHDLATRTESAAVRAYASRAGLDPDKYLDGYKQYWRDVASAASQSSDRSRHPSAHTTVHGLDEAELQYPNLGHGDHPPKEGELPKKPLPILPDEPMPKRPDKPGTKGVYSQNLPPGEGGDNVIPFSQHRPALQINPLESAPGLHAAGVKLTSQASKVKGPKEAEPANVNEPKDPLESFGASRVEHMSKVQDFMFSHPEQWKYLKAVYKQKGGEDWDEFQEMEGLARGRHYEPEGEHGVPEIQPTTVRRFDQSQNYEEQISGLRHKVEDEYDRVVKSIHEDFPDLPKEETFNEWKQSGNKNFAGLTYKEWWDNHASYAEKIHFGAEELIDKMSKKASDNLPIFFIPLAASALFQGGGGMESGEEEQARRERAFTKGTEPVKYLRGNE